jgi:hypothetical protein
VRRAESRKLYSEALGIPFKEGAGEYRHTEAVEGANCFAYGRSIKPEGLLSALTFTPSMRKDL